MSKKILCEVLYKIFSPKWTFVGFYDHHSNGGVDKNGKKYSQNHIYIGEWVSDTIDPTEVIEIGKG